MNSSVYVVHWSADEEGKEHVILIGVFSVRWKAEAAIERCRQHLTFSLPDGDYSICQYAPDVDHWDEGFVTV